MTGRRKFLRNAAAGLASVVSLPLIPREAAAVLIDRGMERRLHIDPRTRVRVWRITSFPTVHQNLYFHSRCWTANGRTFLFKALREPRRGSAYDLFRANTDGSGLTQLTDGAEFASPALHPSEPECLLVRGADVIGLDIETGVERVLLTVDAPGRAGDSGTLTDDGKLYCFPWRATEAAGAPWSFVVADLVRREARIVRLPVAGLFTHLQIEPGGGRIVQFVSDADREGRIVFTSDMEGRITAMPFAEANGHNAWLGATGEIYTNTLGRHRDILAARPGDSKARVVAKAPPRFWHTGISPDGEWMVSDTSSPDAGLHLIHVASGRHEPLCAAGSSQGHAQYTHPHPSVSPGGRHVLFNSDRTGVPHVWCAEIPGEIRERLTGR